MTLLDYITESVYGKRHGRLEKKNYAKITSEDKLGVWIQKLEIIGLKMGKTYKEGDQHSPSEYVTTPVQELYEKNTGDMVLFFKLKENKFHVVFSPTGILVGGNYYNHKTDFWKYGVKAKYIIEFVNETIDSM